MNHFSKKTLNGKL